MTGTREKIAVTEIVDTPEQAAALALPPLLVREPVERFLDEHGLGSGPLIATPLGEGHSNVTYCIRRAGAQVVLRRPPRPPLPPSAHDVLREARVVRGLEHTDVPVPRVLATCADESLLGVPFYVMEYLDGCVLTRTTPQALAQPAHRAAIGERMIAALAALHAVDLAASGLDTLAKPTGYLERQVRRFGALWEAGRTRELPAMNELTTWLAETRPDSPPTTLVHGDYRLGNLIISHGPPVRVLGVIDWEMATLGDPLADLGYLTATLAERGRPDNVMTRLMSATCEPGFPDAAWLAPRYAELTGRPIENLRWYRVLAIWKSAIFLEQSYKRFLSGNEHDPWFAAMADGVPQLVAVARREAGLER